MTDTNQKQLGNTLWSIAECPSSRDSLIAAETQKHAALQCHKHGLMQQLLPSPEEDRRG